MRHAFTWLPTQFRWVLLAVCLCGTVIFAFKLKNQGKPLVNESAPRGIVSYEFAWNRSQAESILNSWSSLKVTAKRQLWLDFGFLLLYPLLLSLACAMLSDSPYNSLAVMGAFLSWAMLAAAPLDAVENLAPLRMLDAGASEGMALVAGWCAAIKFLIIFSGLGYLMLLGLIVLACKLCAA